MRRSSVAYVKLNHMHNYENIIASGYERAIEDYSTGINYSRILSLKYAKLICSAAGLSSYTPVAVGRVMTCVLGMVVRREMEIKNFKKTEYYRILNKTISMTVRSAQSGR